jgi:hypothetical protein
VKRQGNKTSEGHVLDAIRLELGAEPDLVLFRNAVVHAEYWDPKSGKVIHVHGGLPIGSSDLVGIGPGRCPACRAPTRGNFFGLEVKKPGEKPTAEQETWLALARRFGGFGGWADSAEMARGCLERARRGELS